jgi:putative endonuclease
MAFVYILYSLTADKFYIGGTNDQVQRLNYHLNKVFPKSFTAKYNDWELFFLIETSDITIARKVEAPIKKMKSKTYLTNLKKYPEMSHKLLLKYTLQ